MPQIISRRGRPGGKGWSFQSTPQSWLITLQVGNRIPDPWLGTVFPLCPPLNMTIIQFLSFSHVLFFFGCALRSLWDLNSPSRDRTRALGSETAESSPLDHQGIPILSCFSRWWFSWVPPPADSGILQDRCEAGSLCLLLKSVWHTVGTSLLSLNFTL